MTEPRTHTLDVPGAVLTYDVRTNDSSTAPVLLMIGSPMVAAGFSTLAGHFTSRTVVTYDPRGVERSRRTDEATESTPEEHADDLQWMERRPPEPSRLSVVATRVGPRAKRAEFYALSRMGWGSHLGQFCPKTLGFRITDGSRTLVICYAAVRIRRSASSTALVWLAEGRLRSAGLYHIVDPRNAQAVHDSLRNADARSARRLSVGCRP